MKKTSIKPLMMSALVALAMGAIGVGGTFALFTDKAETSIDVGAGIVSAQSELTYISSEELPGNAFVYDEPNEIYRNSIGGSIKFDGTNVTLSNWAPGDLVRFKVKTTNNSDVRILGRYKLTTTGELAGALEVSAEGSALNRWKYYDPSVSPDEIEISVAFPNTSNDIVSRDEGQNVYQGKSATLNFAFEAVQANATVDGAFALEIDDVNKNIKIFDASSMLEFRSLIEAAPHSGPSPYVGYKITLEKDIDMEGVRWIGMNLWYAESNVLYKAVFDGQGHSIKNLALIVDDEVRNPAAGFIATNTLSFTMKDVTFDNIHMAGYYADAQFLGGIIGYNYGSVIFENVTVKNSSLISSDPTEARIGAFVGQQNEGTALTFRNCASKNNELATIFRQDYSASPRITAYSVGGFVGRITDAISASGDIRDIDVQLNPNGESDMVTRKAISFDRCSVTGGNFILANANLENNDDNIAVFAATCCTTPSLYSGAYAGSALDARFVADGNVGSRDQIHFYEGITDGIQNLYAIDASSFYQLNQSLLDNEFGTRKIGIHVLRDIDYSDTWDKVNSHYETNNNIRFFNGHGHTIENVYISNDSHGTGLFGSIVVNETVIFQDLTIKGWQTTGGAWAGLLVGNDYFGDLVFDNVHIVDCKVVGNNWAHGMFVGGNGVAGDGGVNTITFRNCSIEDSYMQDGFYAGMFVGTTNYQRRGSKLAFVGTNILKNSTLRRNGYNNYGTLTYGFGDGYLIGEENVSIENFVVE